MRTDYTQREYGKNDIRHEVEELQPSSVPITAQHEGMIWRVGEVAHKLDGHSL